MADTAKTAQLAGPETVADVSPGQARPNPVVAVDPVQGQPLTDPGQIAGNPLTRYHPMRGRRTFKDANEFQAAGGEDGDYRFKTPAAADAARHDGEAVPLWHRNVRAKLDFHADDGSPTVQNSVAAQESLDSGFPEPGLVPEKG